MVVFLVSFFSEIEVLVIPVCMKTFQNLNRKKPIQCAFETHNNLKFKKKTYPFVVVTSNGLGEEGGQPPGHAQKMT